MTLDRKVRKILDKLLMEPGVSGYSVKNGVITIFVEDDEMLATLSSLSFAGYKMEVKKIGRIQML